jgi:hypothetical protein
MKRLLAVLLLMCGMAAAQCPVEFTKVLNQRYNGTIFVKWKNTSDKTIVGMTFGASFLDAVGDGHPVDWQGYADDHKAEPGKGHSDHWRVALMNKYYGYKKAEVWLTKVKFDDGTLWKDDGTHQCKGAS